jgi:hypothetical protein
MDSYLANHQRDLFAFLRFLRIKPYNDWDMFFNDIAKPLKKGKDLQKTAFHNVQKVLDGCMLRRTRSDVHGESPNVVEHMHTLSFSQREKEFYAILVRRAKESFAAAGNQTIKTGHYSIIMDLVLRLRQAGITTL